LEEIAFENFEFIFKDRFNETLHKSHKAFEGGVGVFDIDVTETHNIIHSLTIRQIPIQYRICSQHSLQSLGGGRIR